MKVEKWQQAARTFIRFKRIAKGNGSLYKPSQCLLPFSYSAGERNVLQTTLLSTVFFWFIFSVPSKLMIIAIQCTFLCMDLFWPLLRARFKPRLTAWSKMSQSRAKTYLCPRTYWFLILGNLFCLLFTNSATHLCSRMMSLPRSKKIWKR